METQNISEITDRLLLEFEKFFPEEQKDPNHAFRFVMKHLHPDIYAQNPKITPDQYHRKLVLQVKLQSEIQSAAKSLGSSKKKRRSAWTGCIQNKRVRKDQRVILPDGTLARVRGARRGKVICYWEDPFSISKKCFDIFKDTALRLYKDPAAVLLGSQKKGVTEKKSHAKSEAARKNGSKPPRPGSRPRGRPRKRV